MSKKLSLSIIVIVILLSVFLFFVFSGKLVLSQSVSLGPLQVRYYGLIMATAVVLARFVAEHRARLYGFAQGLVDDMLPWLVIGGLVGARAYHVLSDFVFYRSNPSSIVKFWNGGLSIYGAVAGGLLAAWWFCRSRKLSLLSVADWLVPSLLVGQVVGRFGNLFNYELYGKATTSWLGMYVPPAFRPDVFTDAAFYHPLFLYEAAALLIGLILVLKFWPKISSSGSLFVSYVLFYNIVRLPLEFLRLDHPVVWGFPQNALVSGGLIVLCVIILNFNLLAGLVSVRGKV